MFQVEGIYRGSIWKQQGIHVKTFFSVYLSVVTDTVLENLLLLLKIFILSFII